VFCIASLPSANPKILTASIVDGMKHGGVVLAAELSPTLW
jgi:hypothetical protein